MIISLVLLMTINTQPLTIGQARIELANIINEAEALIRLENEV